MDFKKQNDIDREYFKQDFKPMTELLFRIRQALRTGKTLDINGINLKGIYDFNPDISFTYITMFQEGLTPIRYGSRRKTLVNTLNRDIEKLRENKNFHKFEVGNFSKCRIMIEFIIERRQTDLDKLHTKIFNHNRFEPGITGLELQDSTASYYYMPTDAVVQSQMGLRRALETLAKRSPIGKMTNKISERLRIIHASYKLKWFVFRTRAFVTYKNECVPLYRGNILYKGFDENILLDQFIKSSDWLIANMYDDGRFLYYYDCKEDNFKDHEHPTRPLDNLYYNDLRHSGGTITLVRAFSQTGDKKYIDAAKKSLDFTVSISHEQDIKGKTGYYTFYNQKAKLGGTGLALIAFMQYRIATGDKSYDEYIKGYARHLLSRMHKSGEFYGYYIHPAYNDGQPLLRLDEIERRQTFSFYYPGEALLGLALFANHFNDDVELIQEVRKQAKKALDWIVDDRPNFYKDLFTALPSDAWLMQAIEEWCNDPEFIKDNYLKFVFDDAKTMMSKTYRADDSPFIDFEGGYYYDYGDHYYPDGARSEGLVAAYYLAQKLGNTDFAQELLQACKKVAACQFQLFNAPEMTYAHKNPARSTNAIRFKATRQWVRVDSIQHVACFFIRLYWALKNS